MNLMELLGPFGMTLFILIVVYSIILHEIAHGWVALKCGDPTAERMGRLTLNPIDHIDPVGTILFPAAQIFLAGTFFLGWAKPVPVNPMNYDSYRRDDILVSLAGIFVNLMIALTLAILLGIAPPNVIPPGSPNEIALVYGIYANVALACFNLLPIPPLDGSHVLKHYLPARWKASYQQIGFYGTFILLFLIVTDVLGAILWPPIRFLGNFYLDLANFLRTTAPW